MGMGTIWMQFKSSESEDWFQPLICCFDPYHVVLSGSKYQNELVSFFSGIYD